MYTEKVNEYSIQEEFWNNEKLPEISAYNEINDIPIYYNIIKKYEENDDIYLRPSVDDDINDIKIKFINMIDYNTTNKQKIEILNDMDICCDEWGSRTLRRNIKKLMTAVINKEIEWNPKTKDFNYNEELGETLRKIKQCIYYYLKKYNIEYNYIKCKPYGNGFMEIKIKDSNRINKEQINAIERITRSHYDYGEVEYNRNGDIININHHFTTKYYVKPI